MKYLGNKERVGSFIDHVLTENNLYGNIALDLFAGTGSVSQILSKKFDSIHSVDKLFLSKVLTHVKLNITPKIDSDIIKELNETKVDGFITNKYSSKVGVNIFTEEIANHIDGALQKLQNSRGKLNENEYLFLLNSILEAADFRSNIMGSYESFYKRGWRKQALKDWSLNLFKNENYVENKFFNMSVENFFEVNKFKYDLVYCDSPYNSRQYSSVFHVPETICNNLHITTKGKVNLPENLFKSEFSQKKQVSNAYDNLINNVSKITDNFLVSYSNEGLLSVELICEKMSRKFDKVGTYVIEYRKFNTNRKNDENKVKEYLIYGKK